MDAHAYKKTGKSANKRILINCQMKYKQRNVT